MNVPCPTQKGGVAVRSFLGIPGARRSALMWLAFTAVACVMTACNVAPTPVPAGAPQAVATRWTALLIGRLAQVDGCLRVTDGTSGTSYLLVWPPEQHSVSMEEDTIHIIDHMRGDKKVIWHIGQVIRLGGGEVTSSEYLDERLRRDLPANCPGPYWIVGDVDIVDASG